MNKKNTTKYKKKTKKVKSNINVSNTVSTLKMKSFLIIILLVIIALIVRLIFLQFSEGERLQTLASSQQTLTETLSAKRGNIYDSKGQALAMSYTSDKIYFNPSDVLDDNKEEIAKNLADILQLNYEELLDKIKSATNMILIASNVEQDKATALTKWKNDFKESQKTGISYTDNIVYLNPSNMNISNKTLITQNLSDILDVDFNELLGKIDSTQKKFVVASDVSSKKLAKVRDWNNQIKETGISIEETTSRSYPSKNLASTVIGFVGSDNQGLYGIEHSWDSILSGTPGKSISLKDASQSEIANSEKTYIAAENGYDITLTIDANIQSIIEKHLAEAVEQYSCDSGMTIAMDPSTGKILAMADYPNFDCNNPSVVSYLAEVWDSLSDKEKSDARYTMWKPKAVTDLYEPGSVFKIITSSIALEENILDTDTYLDYLYCSGSVKFDGEQKPVNCWKKAPFHQSQTLRLALEHSCNPAFMNIGLRIGANTTYKYYEAFGFFEKTGLSISGEPKNGGIFYDVDKIKQIELAIMSFGQRFSITPLQMITAASAIANDGVLLQPQIVDSITNVDTGEITSFDKTEVRQVVSKETADKVASMMESVVTHGSGSRAAVSGYSIGGKTGTSEPVNGSSDGYVASFLAISPVENTKIVLLVILDNPDDKLHNGGQIAAPTASKMLTEILPYMNIESGNKDNNNLNISTDDLY